MVYVTTERIISDYHNRGPVEISVLENAYNVCETSAEIMIPVSDPVFPFRWRNFGFLEKGRAKFVLTYA